MTNNKMKKAKKSKKWQIKNNNQSWKNRIIIFPKIEKQID